MIFSFKKVGGGAWEQPAHHPAHSKGTILLHVFNSISKRARTFYCRIFGRRNCDPSCAHSGRMGRFPAPSLGSAQGSRSYPLKALGAPLGLVILLALFLLPNVAHAGLLWGVSGSSYIGDRSSYVGQYVNLGKGYTGNLKYFYLTADDDASVAYFTFHIYSCSSAISTQLPQAGGDPCYGATEYIYSPIASQSTTADWYGIAENGSGRRLLEADFSYYKREAVSTGATTAYTWATTPLALDASRYYILVVEPRVNLAYTTNASSTGGIALYGIQPTLTDAYGNQMWTKHRLSGSGVSLFADSKIGTAYSYGSDAPLTWQDVGFYAPASSSSQSSLTGAGSFCAGVASSSYAFGIPYGLCYISAFLFVPSQDSVQQFWDNASLVKNVPPFSYAVELQTLYNTTASTSQSIAKISIPWNVFSASTSITLLSSASWTAGGFISAGTLSTIRGVSTIGMYFGFAFYLWRRGRHILKSL